MDILWKHIKTRGLYRIVGFCVIEDGWVAGVKYVKAEGSGEVVRPCHEFFDGRFRQVDATPIERDITLQEIMEEQPTWQGDELDNSSIVPDCAVKAERFGGAVNPESIAAKAERHFAAKKGGEAL